MELHIKNMVCSRCIKVVKQIVEKHQLTMQSIELGKVLIEEEVSPSQLSEVRKDLQEEGFDIVDDQRAMLVQSIKDLVIEKIHHGDLDEMKENFSGYLSAQLHRDYNYLSTLFSSMENTTIEQFAILQKIEKIKELLVYDEMPINDIAFRLGYSSQAHLATQFKKNTGFTPGQFKKLKDHHRNSLDKI